MRLRGRRQLVAQPRGVHGEIELEPFLIEPDQLAADLDLFIQLYFAQIVDVRFKRVDGGLGRAALGIRHADAIHELIDAAQAEDDQVVAVVQVVVVVHPLRLHPRPVQAERRCDHDYS